MYVYIYIFIYTILKILNPEFRFRPLPFPQVNLQTYVRLLWRSV